MHSIDRRRDVNSYKSAERVGFEPTVGLRPRLISSQVHSTTLPPLRSRRGILPEHDRKRILISDMFNRPPAKIVLIVCSCPLIGTCQRAPTTLEQILRLGNCARSPAAALRRITSGGSGLEAT